MYSCYVSQIADGSMKSVHSGDIRTMNSLRTIFLKKHDIIPNATTLVRMTYDRKDFLRYNVVDDRAKGDGITRDSTIVSDGLVVTQLGHALFLPLADCIGAVIHDPVKNILMVSHLGRHNLEQFGGTKSIEFLVENFHCDPEDITVWLSPAAEKDNYPLFAFDNRSMHDVATEQLLAGGVLAEHITSSPVDTTKDTTYFSHSEYLKGHRETDGRFAVVTVMK